MKCYGPLFRHHQRVVCFMLTFFFVSMVGCMSAEPNSRKNSGEGLVSKSSSESMRKQARTSVTPPSQPASLPLVTPPSSSTSAPVLSASPPVVLSSQSDARAETKVAVPAGTAIVFPKDGAVMVWVPVGDFVMGLDPDAAEAIARQAGFSSAAELWAWEAYPAHRVFLDGFFIDKYEVTIGQWKAFVDEAKPKIVSHESSRLFDNPAADILPVAEIRYADAERYATWAGKHIPSEAQWEKAARGTDGRWYPWGNQPAPGPDSELGFFEKKGRAPFHYMPVGCYPKGASPYGAMDMLGNQYEWTTDRNNPYPNNPDAAKMKSYAGSMRVLRGGSWYHGPISWYAAKRFGLEDKETYYHVGVRTVWVPPNDYFSSSAFIHDQKAVPAREAELAASRARCLAQITVLAKTTQKPVAISEATHAPVKKEDAKAAPKAEKTPKGQDASSVTSSERSLP